MCAFIFDLSSEIDQSAAAAVVQRKSEQSVEFIIAEIFYYSLASFTHWNVQKSANFSLNNTNCVSSPHFYDWIFYCRIYAKWNANNGDWDAREIQTILNEFLTAHF